jgi:hypothetical protein
MTPKPQPDDDDPEYLADVVDLHQPGADDLVDDYLQKAGLPREPHEETVADTLGRLDEAIPTPAPTMRIAVAVLAMIQFAVAVPWLVGADPLVLLGNSTSAHRTRDGALGLAVAAAGLLAAWRPHWAKPSFALASFAVIAQTAAGVLDTAIIAGSNELIHLPSIALTCLTGALAIRLSTLAPRRHGESTRDDPG